MVEVFVDQIVVLFPVKVQIPEPIVIVLVLELDDEKSLTVKLKLFALRVPLVKEKLVEQLKASCIVRVPPIISSTKGLPKVCPAEVQVKEPRPSIVTEFEPEVDIPLTIVTEPKILVLLFLFHVGVCVTPVQLMLFPDLGMSMVTVFELALNEFVSKTTSS